MTQSIVTKNGQVSTHGIMKVEFAIEGLTMEEVLLKFDNLVSNIKLSVHSSIDEKEYEVEVFNHTIGELETFEEDEC